MEALRNHVEDFPDAYQYERVAHFNVSPNCILYALRLLKISHKKNVLPSQVGSGKRAEFENQLLYFQHIEKRNIVYIDESGFAQDTARDYGYSSRGSRCYASKDWHSGGRVNAIGAIHNFEMLNICLFQGNINADVFHA